MDEVCALCRGRGYVRVNGVRQDCVACKVPEKNPTELTADETVTYTTADEAYDWFGTRTLGVVGKDKRGKQIRRVASPSRGVEAQRGRYMSGLHLAVDDSEWKKLVDYKLVETI